MEELRRYTKPMTCRLDDHELRQYGDDLARCLEEIADQVVREDSVKKELKARMSELESKCEIILTRPLREDEQQRLLALEEAKKNETQPELPVEAPVA
jgi:hypothetical protein